MSTQVLRSCFEVEPLNDNAFAIHDGSQTVALISEHGDVDWLAVTPQGTGERIRAMAKEPHHGNVRGLLFNLHPPLPKMAERLEDIQFDVQEHGRLLRIRATSYSTDHRFLGWQQADLYLNKDTKRYEWMCQSSLTYLLPEPVQLTGIEYNNILPAQVGGRLMHASAKRFTATLLQDQEGIAWLFPHQHLLHYHEKIAALRFSTGAMAGFIGETLNPMIILEDSPFPPTWAICDGYFDLHCCASPQTPLLPNRAYTWRYRLCYLDADSLAPVMRTARPIVLTPDDYATHVAPRLELGVNHFQNVVRIDVADEACGFRLDPPTKDWEPTGGPNGTGALLMTHATPMETVWSASWGTQVPAGSYVRFRAQVKPDSVIGRGCYLRLRPLTYEWHPAPHVNRWEELVSPAVTGTTEEWVTIEAPELQVPLDIVDCELEIALVFEGAGCARVGELELQCLHAVHGGIGDDHSDTETSMAAVIPGQMES